MYKVFQAISFAVLLLFPLGITAQENETNPLNLSSDELSFLKSHPIITLGGGTSFEPFVIVNADGTFGGYDVEIANIIAAKAGFEIQFGIGEWQDVLGHAESREFDGLMTTSDNYDQDRASYFKKTDAYITVQPVIIVKKGNPLNIKTPEDLRGRLASVQKGNTYFADILKSVNDGAKLYETDDIYGMVRSVVSGDADFTVLDETAFYIASIIGLGGLIETAFPVGEPYGICFSLRNDWPELTSIFNKGLDSITRQQLYEIRKKWFQFSDVTDISSESKLTFTGEELSYISQHPTLKIGFSRENLPYSINSGKGEAKGIISDYMELLSTRVGSKIQLVPYISSNGALNLIEGGFIDALFVSDRSQELMEETGFLKTDCYEDRIVIATKDDKLFIEDIQNFKSETFAVIKGDKIVEYLKKLNVKTVEVSDISEGYSLLQKGEIYGYIDSLLSNAFYIQNEITMDFKISGLLGQEHRIFSIGSPAPDTTLYSILRKAVRSISKEENLQLVNRWITVKYDQGVDYSLVWKVLLISSIIILSSLFWNMKLRTAKKLTQKTLLDLKTTQRKTNRALNELQIAQDQLIHAEKMAALGQLIAGIAHEINSPLGAISSSQENISLSLHKALNNLPRVYHILSQKEKESFQTLLARPDKNSSLLSSRESRKLIRSLSSELEKVGIENPRYFAGMMVQMGVLENVDIYLPLLRHSNADLIIETAYAFNAITTNTATISNAVERASKVIYALKSFSHHDTRGEKSETDIKVNLETVLTLYHHQIKQGIDIIREYEEIPMIECFPDELGQVWTNLVHNAVHAMNNQGQLKISIGQENGNAVISISDNGSGMEPGIQSKIFDPFFTTKQVGEGTGLGLDIVKKIIDKHQGKIELESQPGVGSTFKVFLPYDGGTKI